MEGQIRSSKPRFYGLHLNSSFLTTDHLLPNLKGRALSSGAITLVAQGSQFVLNLVSIVTLARLLTPADFGLIAMSMTVMSFLRVFKDIGLSTATVQRENITHSQVSNLFWVNVMVSTFIGLLLVAAAEPIAWFYAEPRLVPITLILSVTLPLSGLTVQHSALLARQMRFKAIAGIQIVSQLVGIGVGVGMAIMHCGYWAVVGLNVSTVAVTVLLTFILVPWRPNPPARDCGTRPLIKLGTNLAAGGFLYSLARGSDSLLIGRTYGSDAVGLYSRAAALLNRPLEQLLCACESVFVPMLSRLQSQSDLYRSNFLRFYEAVVLVSSLFAGLLLALSRPVTLLILGPKWEQAAAIFAGFAVSALCAPATTMATWLFASQGRGKGMLLTSCFMSVMLVISVLVGLRFGPAGVSLAYSAIGIFVGLPAVFYLAGREGPVTNGDLWIGFLRSVPIWCVVAGSTYLIHIVLGDAAPLTQLTICSSAGLVVGGSLIMAVRPLRSTLHGIVLALKGALAVKLRANST